MLDDVLNYQKVVGACMAGNNWHQNWIHERDLKSTAYSRIVKGPEISIKIETPIHRKELIQQVKELITPKVETKLCHFIVGNFGPTSGKRNLLGLTVNDMEDRSGV